MKKLILLAALISTGAAAGTRVNMTWDPNPPGEGVDRYEVELRIDAYQHDFSARLQSKRDNRCVTVGEGNVFDMQNCTSSTAQQFFFGDGVVVSRFNGTCVTVSSAAAGTVVTGEPCNNSTQQTFTQQQFDNAQRFISSFNTDIATNNDSLVAVPWTEETNQQWYLRDYVRRGAWELVSTVPDAQRDANGFVSESLYAGQFVSGTQLCFRIRAFRGSELSPYSEESCGTVEGGGVVAPPPTSTALSAPTGFQINLQNE